MLDLEEGGEKKELKENRVKRESRG